MIKQYSLLNKFISFKGVPLLKQTNIHISIRWYPNPGIVANATRTPNPHSIEVYKALKALQMIKPSNNAVGFPRSNKYPYYPLYPKTKPYDNPLMPSSLFAIKPALASTQNTLDSSVETKVLLDPVLLQQIVKVGLSQGISEEDTMSKLMDTALVTGEVSRMMALNYLLTRNLEMSDQYYITLKEILEEWSIIQNEQDILSITKAYEELFKNLKNYIESQLPVKEGPGMSKNYKEYLQLIKHIKDIDSSTLTSKKDFYEFIKTEEKSRCFLPEDFEQQIAQNEKALKIVFDPTTTKTLTEREVLALLHRVGVVTYPDASYFVALNAVNRDGSVAKDNYIEKESEGVKILSKVYRVLVKDNYVSVKEDRLSIADAKSAIKSIEAGQLKVGTITSDPDHQTLIISGKRLHPIVVIQHPRDKDAYLIVGNLTSAGEDTLVLSKKQPNLDNNEDNMALSDVPEKDKEQRFLLGKSFIKISKAEFKEKVNGTTYLEGNDEQGYSIVRKIIANFQQNKESICDQPVEALQEFTLEQLLDSAKVFLFEETQQLQQNLNQLVTKLVKMSENDRKDHLNKMRSQGNNELKNARQKEYYENLTRKEQVLYNFYKKLVEIRAKSKEITKRIKDKIHIEEQKENAKKALEKELSKDSTNNNTKASKNNKVNKNDIVNKDEIS